MTSTVGWGFSSVAGGGCATSLMPELPKFVVELSLMRMSRWTVALTRLSRMPMAAPVPWIWLSQIAMWLPPAGQVDADPTDPPTPPMSLSVIRIRLDSTLS